jgi:hypothetical protein
VTDYVLVLRKVKKLSDALNYLYAHHSLLDLGELKDDGDQPRHVPFGLKSALVAKLKAVKSNIDKVFVEKQVLTLLIGEDDHKCFDEGVPEMRINQLLVIWADVFHANFLDLLCIFIRLLVSRLGAMRFRNGRGDLEASTL